MRAETTRQKFSELSYGQWARVIDHLKHRASEQKRSLASLCSSRPAATRTKGSAPGRKPCRIAPVQDHAAPIQVPGTAAHPSAQCYDLVAPSPDSFGVYEYLIRSFEGCVALSIINESHNGRAQSSDIARAMHRVMRAAQTHMLTSGTHFGGDIVSFFFYWFRFHPQFWRTLGLKWRQASEAQRRYGVIQLWTKEYESDARKGGGKTDVQVSTIPAPGLSAKLIPYLLELLAFLTVLDVGAFMPEKIELPEVVSMRDPLVETKAREAVEIVKGAQQALADLEREKQQLFAAVRDGQADREVLLEWSRKEEAARLALEEARAESKQLNAWVEEHDLLGAYLRMVKSLSGLARKGNQTARMAQGAIPRWFAVLPCEKPFELWQTKRTTWGDEMGKHLLLKTPQLAWDYLYPLEKRLIELVEQERAEGRRLMLYIDQNEERSMGKRLQWVLQQAGIASWILPNQVKPEDRQQAIIDAMSTHANGAPAVTVAIVPYARVNEGINLQSVVDTIIWYEMALNLFMLEQASRRAWRLGKREEVRIYYMAYAGTAGHQKMRKLGGQSGAAASFAGEPARGALIEEAGADRTTLARFSATVEAELLTDEDVGDEDPQALVEVTDADELKAAFSLRANEERAALKRGRTWLGAIDTLSEQLPTFFTRPQPAVWEPRPAPRPVQVVSGTAPEAPIFMEPGESAPTLPVAEVSPLSPASDVPIPDKAEPGAPTAPTPSVAPMGEKASQTPLPAPAKPQKAVKQPKRETHREATAALIFGNIEHILLSRQRRNKAGKASAKPAAKKPYQRQAIEQRAEMMHLLEVQLAFDVLRQDIQTFATQSHEQQTLSADDLMKRAQALEDESHRLNMLEGVTTALMLRAELLMALQRDNEAITALVEARYLLRSHWQYDRGVAILARLAEANAHKYNWAAVSSICDEGIELIEQYRYKVTGQYLQSSYLESRIRLYSLGVKSAYELGDYALMLKRAELSKCRSVLRYQQQTLIPTQAMQDTEKEFRRVSEQIQMVGDGNALLEELRQKRRTLWDLLLIQRFQKRTGKSFPKFSLKDLQATLAIDEAVIYYYWLDKYILLIITIDQERIVTESRTISRDQRQELEKFAHFVLELRPDFKQQESQKYLKLKKVLDFSSLLLPREGGQLLEEKKRLLISSHRLLHAFPFHALQLESDFLIQHFAVSYAPNLTSLLLRYHRPGEPNVLALGIYKYEIPDQQVSDLEEAEVEVEDIRDIYEVSSGTVMLLKGQEARRKQLQGMEAERKLEQFTCLHFATHGMNVDSDTPMESYLLLQNSLLDGLEIANWRLNAETVVLSACCSGQRPITGRGLGELPGDELFGLQAAFLCAGAKRLLCSLWPVDSPSAHTISTSFHRYMTKGILPEVALQAALKDYLATAGPRTRKIYYWAPFFLSMLGKPDSNNIQGGSNHDGSISF